MTGALFNEWIRALNNRIIEKYNRKVLHIDGQLQCTQKSLLHANYCPRRNLYLSSYTKSKLQPLDYRIIASVKVNYKRRHFEHAVNFSENGVNDI